MNCSYCNEELHDAISKYSFSLFKVPLCIRHQYWFKKALAEDHNTTFVLQLYVRLRELGVNPKLNKYDGHKTIDIALEKAKIHIEVDGVHHNKSATQALSDLKRTFYDMKRGITTIRIPNTLIQEGLDSCVEFLKKMVDIKTKNSSIYQRSHK